MPHFTLISIIIAVYISLTILSWIITFKMIRDYNRVYYFAVHQINHIIYYFCLLIAKHRPIIPKFEEFVPLVFAQKKHFLFHTSHSLKDYTDLYYGLKDDMLYTEKYMDKNLHDRDELVAIEDSLSFLNKVYGSVHFMRRVFAIITFWIGPAVVFRPMK